MLKVVFLFAKTDAPEIVDDFIDKYVIAPLTSSPGYHSHTMNTEPLMSPMGPPAHYKIVEATLRSLDDFIAIGRSELIQESQKLTPENTSILFYEFEA